MNRPLSLTAAKNTVDQVILEGFRIFPRIMEIRGQGRGILQSDFAARLPGDGLHLIQVLADALPLLVW